MDNDHKKACFEFLRIGPGETFEKPETWMPNTRHYMNLLEEKKDQDVFFSWSWPGFFMFPYWAFYRKMILFGTLSFLFIGIAWPLGHVFGGAIANSLYLHFVRRKVALGKAQSSGTSWLNAILAFCGTFIIGVIFILMLVMIYHNTHV